LNIILLLGIIAFNLTISRLNYNFFSSYGFSGKNLGSVIDLMPIVAIGCIFRSMDILSKIKHFSKYFYLLLLNLIFLLFEYDIFVNIPELRFSNVLLFLSAAVIFFILFGSISFDKIKNKKIILILMNITKFTGGIYYTHPTFLAYLVKLSSFFKKRNYINALLIYIISYCFCLIGSKLFINNKLKYLFI